MGSTWCRQCTSQAVCLVFLLANQRHQAGTRQTFGLVSDFLALVSPTLPSEERLSRLLRVGGGCKILNSRHACLAAGQTPPVSSFLFLIRAVSFRMLKKDLRPRTSLFTDSRLPNSFLSGLNRALLNWWVVNQKGFCCLD